MHSMYSAYLLQLLFLTPFPFPQQFLSHLYALILSFKTHCAELQKLDVYIFWTSGVGQQATAIATKPNDLSWIP